MVNSFRAAYLQLGSDILQRRVGEARARLTSCDLCARYCRVDRLRDERGACGLADEIRVYSHNPHFGEEPPLVGSYGSGTIFFSRCNLNCVFCQNWEISQRGEGRELAPKQLAGCWSTFRVRTSPWSDLARKGLCRSP